ncbi:heat shock factor 2-binding protein isoform X4 [Scleropages formosus]|uniref:heat shock factor 2-binding protein isoform X4 n=1 Tax=Scleropages formosus TaxID=113540 RepID=UPI00087909E9|nr:heat shock factor 2-binding protein isoform X4 [Scleropages formosus]
MYKTHWRRDRGGFVRVRKRDLERLTTEVMQLRDFLPKVISRDVLEKVRQGHVVDVVKERIELEREQLQQDYLHLCSRLDAAHCECQREREEKLALRQQLWVSQEQLQQQAEFCTTLGVASCTLLWSVSSKEEVIKDILADRKAEAFLAVAAQTLESFVGQSLDREGKVEQQTSSQEMQFVLALAGIVTNIAAVTCGRDFLSSSAHMLLDTLMQLLGVMKPGVFSKLKVLMLMALYNVSISIKGLKYISESSCLLQLLPSLLQVTGRCATVPFGCSSLCFCKTMKPCPVLVQCFGTVYHWLISNNFVQAGTPSSGRLLRKCWTTWLHSVVLGGTRSMEWTRRALLNP